MDTNLKALWTVEELADYLRITTGAARAMIRRDQVPQEAVRRIGRRIRIISAVVRDWVLKKSA